MVGYGIATAAAAGCALGFGVGLARLAVVAKNVHRPASGRREHQRFFERGRVGFVRDVRIALQMPVPLKPLRRSQEHPSHELVELSSRGRWRGHELDTVLSHTPSRTQVCKWTWRFRLEPNLCTNVTEPGCTRPAIPARFASTNRACWCSSRADRSDGSCARTRRCRGRRCRRAHIRDRRLAERRR